MPLRRGGLGLRAQEPLRGLAYLGSWIGNLEGVRDRCPSGVASRERFAAGDRAWARALTEAQAELAAEGVHLTDQGDVLSSPPRAGWAWQDDSAEVPQVQRALTKALEEKRQTQLLLRLSPEDRARVSRLSLTATTAPR